MRDRSAIESDMNREHGLGPDKLMTGLGLALEVLLDIRDLLTPARVSLHRGDPGGAGKGPAL